MNSRFVIVNRSACSSLVSLSSLFSFLSAIQIKASLSDVAAGEANAINRDSDSLFRPSLFSSHSRFLRRGAAITNRV